MPPYFRERPYYYPVGHFGRDDVFIAQGGFNVLPVPSHVIMSVFLWRIAICGIGVVEVLLDIQPWYDTVQGGTQCVPFVNPEVSAHANISVEHISFGLYLLVGLVA